MGEKLLAQRLIRLLRDTNGRTGRAASILLGWVSDEREWLWPDLDFDAEPPPPSPRGRGGLRAVPVGGEAVADAISWERLPALAASIDLAEPPCALLACVDAAAELLAFDPFERQVLRAAAALERMPRLASLRSRLAAGGEDMITLVGRLAGASAADAAGRMRRCGPVALGLVKIQADYPGAGVEMLLDWRFASVLDQGMVAPDRLIDSLAGVRQTAALRPEDFVDQTQAFSLLVRLLEGALRNRAAGVNLLIYGPPGTGKTELARTLAAAAGAALYAVGEVDADGEEPSRSERVCALRRAQRLLARRGGSALLFDEMEDLFGSDQSNRPSRRGSKIFVNRLLEANEVPTIWTTNTIGEIDPAYLRRMSYVLAMGYPGPRARARIVARAAHDEGVAAAVPGLDSLVSREAAAASVARAALRSTALAGGGAEDAAAVAGSLLRGLRGGQALTPAPARCALDLDLYEAEPPIASLIDRIAAPAAAADVSLLLTGPPGTGKTALAAHLADRLDRPLSVKRASDLLSAWVGGTETNIAAAFAEAREQGAVLLFDEVDSLLLARADAQRSWEISQVNELLT